MNIMSGSRYELNQLPHVLRPETRASCPLSLMHGAHASCVKGQLWASLRALEAAVLSQ
jgi:hypothetical protein